MSGNRTGDEPEAITGGREVEGDTRKWTTVHVADVDEAWAAWQAMGRKLTRLTPIHHYGPAVATPDVSRTPKEWATETSIAEVPHVLQASGGWRVMGSGEPVPGALAGNAEEQLAAEAVDRMIAKLDTATATVEAQLAELRRMRRAA